MDYLTPPAVERQRAGSLLAAANTPTARLERLLAGVGYETPACTGWRLYDPCGDGDPVDHDSDTVGSFVQGNPFPVQVFDGLCSPNTFTSSQRDEAQRAAAARDRLERIESAAIARELWTGEMATSAGWDDNPRLAGPDTTVLASGAALPLVEGVAALTDALADALAGAPAALHMTRGTLLRVAAAGVSLARTGFVIEDVLGAVYVADAGYPGTDPDGDPPADGEAWIYGTARPTVYRSQVFPTGPVLDRDVNTLQASAEEYALVTLSCGVYAARVTLP